MTIADLENQINIKNDIISKLKNENKEIILNTYKNIITTKNNYNDAGKFYSIDTVSTIKEFVDENKDLITFKNELKDYNLNTSEFLNKINDSEIKETIKLLFDATTYVTFDEFNKKIKNICDIVNESKNINDIYILVLPNEKNNYIWHKSNLWVSFMSVFNGLNIDIVFDISNSERSTVYQDNETYMCELLFNKLLINQNLDNKNINFIICDDCAYSGHQINGIFKYLENDITNVYKKHNIGKHATSYKIIPIIPYILSDITMKLIQNKNVFNISEKLMTLYTDVRSNIKTISSALIGKKPNKLIDDIIGNNNNMRNNLIYFQFKAADGLSVPVWLYSGNIQYMKKYDNSINCDKEYISVKNNCTDNGRDCPSGLYKEIKYTYNNKPIYMLMNSIYRHFYDLPTTLCILAGDTNNRVRELKN